MERERTLKCRYMERDTVIHREGDMERYGERHAWRRGEKHGERDTKTRDGTDVETHKEEEKPQRLYFETELVVYKETHTETDV